MKQILKQVLPPLLIAALKRTAPNDPDAGKQVEWEMIEDSDAAWIKPGWSDPSVADTQRRNWTEFVASLQRGSPLGSSHEAPSGMPGNIGAHNTYMTFGYALGRALVGRSRLSILDWGGGLGNYALIARALYPMVEFDYIIKDLPALCEIGRTLLPNATFIEDEATIFGRSYDFVLASSSVHYSRNPYALVDQLCRCASGYVLVTRSPFISTHDDFLVLQRPHRYGYLTEYPGWFINRTKFVAFVQSRGFELVREFMVAEHPVVANAPEQCRYGGFLFQRSSTGI